MASGLNPLLAYAAGALTILSPCVLPLVPIVFSAAGQKHRFGPFALAAGLVVSFTATGFLVATAGDVLGVDSDLLRSIGGILLLIVGVALLIPATQQFFERLAGPLATLAAGHQSRLERFGLTGQAGIGVLLGLVWSPCVGPTLGAATVLAAQGEDLGEAAVVMAAFGLGIATMLLVLGLAARSLIAHWRVRLLSAGQGGKKVLGGLIVVVGLLIVTGYDRSAEAALLAASPQWLTNLTTSI